MLLVRVSFAASGWGRRAASSAWDETLVVGDDPHGQCHREGAADQDQSDHPVAGGPEDPAADETRDHDADRLERASEYHQSLLLASIAVSACAADPAPGGSGRRHPPGVNGTEAVARPGRSARRA